MQLSLDKITIIYNIVILYSSCIQVTQGSQTTSIGISLSKYQLENETYIKFPNAERLGNPLKSFKVWTNTRCAASCSAIPEYNCRSYNLRKINGQNHTKVCELLGLDVSIDNPSSTIEDVDHYQRTVACIENLQLISGDIYYVEDAKITASSVWGSGLDIYKSRLDYPSHGGGSWAARRNDVNQWIQADLGGLRVVTSVVTQGRADYPQWVKSYKFFYGKTETDLEDYGMNLPGNVDSHTKVTNTIEPPVIARFVRVNPQTWHGHISMRFGVMGCS